jgi:hypothetical protein
MYNSFRYKLLIIAFISLCLWMVLCYFLIKEKVKEYKFLQLLQRHTKPAITGGFRFSSLTQGKTCPSLPLPVPMYFIGNASYRGCSLSGALLYIPTAVQPPPNFVSIGQPRANGGSNCQSLGVVQAWLMALPVQYLPPRSSTVIKMCLVGLA